MQNPQTTRRRRAQVTPQQVEKPAAVKRRQKLRKIGNAMAMLILAAVVVLLVITVRCLSGTPLAPTKKRLLLAVVLWLLFALSWIPMGIAVTEPEMIRKVAWFNACKGWVRNILLIGSTAHTARLIKGRNRKS